MEQVENLSRAHFAFFNSDAHAPYATHSLFALLVNKMQTALMLESSLVEAIRLKVKGR